MDRGTAFDIAGSGKADSRSMVAAIHQAAQMATRANWPKAQRLVNEGFLKRGPLKNLCLGNDLIHPVRGMGYGLG